MTQTTETHAAWFWTIKTATLWVGVHGVKYPDSFELERCGSRTADTACEVFTRLVAPYAKHAIPEGKVSRIKFKTIYYLQ